ncbi:624_t:CDS:2, partial [Gigaspora rosea]
MLCNFNTLSIILQVEFHLVGTSMIGFNTFILLIQHAALNFLQSGRSDPKTDDALVSSETFISSSDSNDDDGESEIGE